MYPVIVLATPYGHAGSLRNLLGENPSQELIESLSNERQVTKDTPPTFLSHTNADSGVPAENSFLFAMASEKPVFRSSFTSSSAASTGSGLEKESRSSGSTRAVLSGLAQALRNLAQESRIS